MVKSKGLVFRRRSQAVQAEGTGNARQGSNTSPLGRAVAVHSVPSRTAIARNAEASSAARAPLALSLRARRSGERSEGLAVDATPKRRRSRACSRRSAHGKNTLLSWASRTRRSESGRNRRNVQTTLAHQLNAYDLLDCEQLLLTQDGLARVKEVFTK